MRLSSTVIFVALVLAVASLLFYASGGTFLGGREQSTVNQCDIGYYSNGSSGYTYLFIHSPERGIYARIGDILRVSASENSQTVKMEIERRPLSWKEIPSRVTLFVPQHQEDQWQDCITEIQDQFLRNNRVQNIPLACRSLNIVRLPKFVN